MNRSVLAALVNHGFRLGVVSNACGNVSVLCAELGYGNSLDAIVDSHRFGSSKPDLAIFRHALDLLKTSPERTGFVGDSLERDIVPAKTLGMRTFWLPDPNLPRSRLSIADVTLASVADLPAVLLGAEADGCRQ